MLFGSMVLLLSGHLVDGVIQRIGLAKAPDKKFVDLRDVFLQGKAYSRAGALRLFKKTWDGRAKDLFRVDDQFMVMAAGKNLDYIKTGKFIT